MINEKAKKLRKNINKSSAKNKSSLSNVCHFAQQALKLSTKARETSAICTASALNSVGNTVSSIFNYRSKRVKQIMKENEKKHKKRLRNARIAAAGIGVCGLGIGVCGGYYLGKRDSAKLSDYTFDDPYNNKDNNKDNYSQDCGNNSFDKQYREEVDGYMLSSDGTTLLQK